MHELSIVLEIIKTVENFADENHVKAGEIESLTLQIGELSSTVPKYVEDVYPDAVDGTILDGSKLIVEILPGEARCKSCGLVFNVREHKAVCPSCGGKELELLSGREFYIKEISILS
jgi:hydrogenase nickel incorporation protein HypA/HybF